MATEQQRNELYAALYIINTSAFTKEREFAFTFQGSSLANFEYITDYTLESLNILWTTLIIQNNVDEIEFVAFNATNSVPRPVKFNIFRQFVNIMNSLQMSRIIFTPGFAKAIEDKIIDEKGVGKTLIAAQLTSNPDIRFNMNILTRDIQNGEFPFYSEVNLVRGAIPTAPTDSVESVDPMFSSDQRKYSSNKRTRETITTDTEIIPETRRRIMADDETPAEESINTTPPTRVDQRLFGDRTGLSLRQPPPIDQICCLIHSSDSTPSSQKNRSTMNYNHLSNLMPLGCQSDIGTLLGLSEELHGFSDNILHFTSTDCQDVRRGKRSSLEGYYATAYKCLHLQPDGNTEPNVVFRANTIILPHNALLNGTGDWSDILTKFDASPSLRNVVQLQRARIYTVKDNNNITYELNPYLSYHIEVIARDYIEHLKRRSLRELPTINILYQLNRNEIDSCPTNVMTLMAQIILMFNMFYETNLDNINIPAMPLELDIKPELRITLDQGKNLYNTLNRTRLPIMIGIQSEFLNYFLHNCYPYELSVERNGQTNRFLTRPINIAYKEKFGIVATQNICIGDPLVYGRSEEFQMLLQRGTRGVSGARREEIAREPPQSRTQRSVDKSTAPEPESLTEEQILLASRKRCGIILF